MGVAHRYTMAGVLLLAVLALAACAADQVVVAAVHPDGQNCGQQDCHSYRHTGLYADAGCADCHVSVLSWTNTAYAHANGDFNIGFHDIVGCGRCHKATDTAAPTPACVGCHEPSHEGSTACAQCHTAWWWRPARLLPNGHFPLTGKHNMVGCEDCHKRGPAAANDCAACHGSPHGSRLTKCAACHTTAGFAEVRFRHSSVYALRGAHSDLACSKCHSGLRFSGVKGTACQSCHGGAAHGGLGACERCHTTNSFSPSTFNHSSKYRLTGAHTRLRCSACHPLGRFTNVAGTRCSDCHGSAHGGLTQCQKCHTTTSFKRTTFRHASVYPLTGRHAGLACSRCHPGSRYAQVKGRRCVNCHGTKHDNRTNCESCHSPVSWQRINSSFRHPEPFLLVGQHRQVTCSACHPSLRFNGAPRVCEKCHPTTPHVGPRHCADCHTPVGWSTAPLFTHVRMTFHTAAINSQCSRCHTGGNFTQYSCGGCHVPPRTYPPPGY